jgi:hypothetical protein
MSNIPIAKEFARSFTTGKIEETPGEYIEAMLIAFAKLHVEKALKAASKSKSTYVKIDLDGNRTHPIGLNENSVLNAYPLTNIK